MIDPTTLGESLLTAEQVAELLGLNWTIRNVTSSGASSMRSRGHARSSLSVSRLILAFIEARSVATLT